MIHWKKFFKGSLSILMKSEVLFQKAIKVIPCGVNSPVRFFQPSHDQIFG